MQYRQGDVLIERVDSMPASAVELPGNVILAHGENTGHAHRIASKHAKLFEAAGERFLRVGKSAALRHEEHDRISIPPGDYKVTRQREYSPEAIRFVAD